MKAIVKLSLLIIICQPNIVTAQVHNCYQSYTTSSQSSSQPTTCINYLKNFIPSSNDRILEVKVNVVVFVPTTNSATSAWTHSSNPTTYTSAIACLTAATSEYSNMPSTPQLTLAGVPSLTDAKLKFTLNSFSVIAHDNAYNDVISASIGTPSNGGFGTQWHNQDVINVFLGNLSPSAFGVGCSLPNPCLVTPSNVIHFTQHFNSYTVSPGILIDNFSSYGRVLAHEIGHFLGLTHSTGPSANTPTGVACLGEPMASISSSFACCGIIEANDYVHEAYQCVPHPVYQNQFQLNVPSAFCNSAGYSDNMMSQNAGCNRYLSPQQVAVIHHNLRTVQRHLLTSSGYTAATLVDHNYDYIVSTNEIWNEDRYMKGDVFVLPNKTLEIKCGVAMTKGAKIIVSQGAQLILDGAKITNISGELWEGIYLSGYSFQPQIIANPNNTGAVLYQALLRMKNNATISNAKIGVRNYGTGGVYDYGGIIFAMNSNFINNKTDVDFKCGKTPLTSASWFTNCKFVTDGQIGYGTQPLTHVNIYRTNGVTFRGCEFEWISGGNGNRGVGITSSDATYFVDKNGSSPTLFKKLREGVRCNNINPLRVPDIRNSKFEDNVLYAGYFINTNYLSFQSNTVQVVSSAGNPEGIYLNNCQNYTLKSNVFTQTSGQTGKGLNIYRSLSGSHQVFRNTFSDLFMGINCMDNNGNSTDGLLMNCNVFNSSPNLYDIVMSHTTGLALPTVKKTQGEIFQANATNVVRNIYGATCGNQNMWQIYSGATLTIDHGANTNSTTAITQPTATGCKSPPLSVVDMSISLNYTAHCPGNPTSSGGGGTTSTQKLAVMNDYIDVLQSDNPDGINNFEIQATVSSKINLFLTDTLNADGLDSVIAIFRSNQGNLADARLQLAFAYLAKNDLENAEIKIDSLDWDGQYPDWKPLMQKLLALQSDTIEGIFSLNSDADNREFFQEYADTYAIEGQALAQAILKVACDSNYTEPHALPEGESGSRLFNNQTPIENVSSVVTPVISIMPNPTNKGVTLTYRSESNSKTRIEIRDLVGKLIYSNFISNQNEDVYIPLDDLASGMYLITLSGNKNVIYKNKIIKQD